MNNYASVYNSFPNTNSAISVIGLSLNGSNKETYILKEQEKTVSILGMRDILDTSLYMHITNNIRISNNKNLTKSIGNIENLSVSDIYDFLDRRISALKNNLKSDLEYEISERATEEARYILKEYIAKLNLIAPKVKPIPSNEINLNWDYNDFYLDMAIVGDGTYSFYLKDKISGEEIFDDLELREKLPSFVVEKLNRNFQFKYNAQKE